MDLTPGKVYYIRVYDYGNEPAPDGRFEICVEHGAAVGISMASQVRGLRLYPNPTAGRLRIELPEGGKTLQIFNLEGQVLQIYSATTGVLDLDLSNLSKGLYLAVIQTENGVWREKIVLE